jgi:DNA-binding transcriptional regulator LsrR (DeoR family)
MSDRARQPRDDADGGRFALHELYAAAQLYYVQNLSQEQVAQQLGTSRPRVSRLLAEARRRGIVRIEVVPPVPAGELASELAAELGLREVQLGPAVAPGAPPGTILATALGAVLARLGLRSGDVLLISSGRTVWQAAQTKLPSLPGVVLAPTIGGLDEVAPWFQTNEITRQVAEAVGGHPRLLYAPALPSPELHATLLRDSSTNEVLRLWDEATAAVMGVGAPLRLRDSIPTFLPSDWRLLPDSVGDISSRFFDERGDPVSFPGEERLLSVSREQLRAMPASIALAAGEAKVGALIAAARAKLYSILVTDQATASQMLTRLRADVIDLAIETDVAEGSGRDDASV